MEFHHCAVDKLAKEDFDCPAKNLLTAIDLEADLGEAMGTLADEGPGMRGVFPDACNLAAFVMPPQ